MKEFAFDKVRLCVEERSIPGRVDSCAPKLICPHPEYLGIWDDGTRRVVRVTWRCEEWGRPWEITGVHDQECVMCVPHWTPPASWAQIERAPLEAPEPYEPKRVELKTPWDPYPDGVA